MVHSDNIDQFPFGSEPPSVDWVIRSEIEDIEQFTDEGLRLEAGRTSLLGLVDRGEITFEQAREHGRLYFGRDVL